ncbi:MAG: HipA domain-containing protein [Gemmatimonadota bacterium]
MELERCFLCCERLGPGTGLYHPRCSAGFFGGPVPPELPYGWDDLNPLAEQVIRSRISVPGVQPKLSLHVDRGDGGNGRLTLVGLWGDFILKPPHRDYPGMPELEHACMTMARSCGVETVPFALMPLKSGELAFLSRRVDRDHAGKLHMEDMAQLTGKMTEQKYRGSMEQIGKTIWAHSATPLLDVVRLFQLAVFCFLTANTDMHLKNFSLLGGRDGRIRLAPAYDLLATQILMPSEREESALTIQGRKSNLTVGDFRSLADHYRLTPKQTENVFTRLRKSFPQMDAILRRSFVLGSHKEELSQRMRERAERLGIL